MSFRDPHAGRLVSALRRDKGLSPEALAFEIAKRGGGYISGRTIRRIENNGVIPTVRVQFALASFFDMRPSQVWTDRTSRAVAA
jgi:transcriptional regulator with XRE-family HTH domain